MNRYGKEVSSIPAHTGYFGSFWWVQGNWWSARFGLEEGARVPRRILKMEVSTRTSGKCRESQGITMPRGL